VLAGGINLSAGSHTINVRVLDNAGNWSPVFSSAITALQPASNIILTRAEYFIDADPGQGSATPMLAFNGNFNTALQTVLAGGINLSAGSHTINVRVLDNAGNWSPVFSSAITSLTTSAIQLTQGEYFWDTDPGQGNGSPMLAIAGFNSSLEQLYQSIAAPAHGPHVLNVRVLDNYGNWSPVFGSVVYNYAGYTCDTISIHTGTLTVCPGSSAVIQATVTGPDALPSGGGSSDGGTSGGGVVNPVGIVSGPGGVIEGGTIGGTGDLNFQWQVNGVNSGTNSPVFITSETLADSSLVNCILTSTSCPGIAYSDTLIIRVRPNLYPAINISSSATTVCEGTEINFFGSSSVPGTSPLLNWYVNGDSVYTNSYYFYPDSLQNGDVVTLLLVSNDPCAVTDSAWSNPITITVVPNATQSVTIVNSNPPVCAGQTAEFIATAVNAGSSPAYFWYLDGVYQASGANTYYNDNLVDSDYIYCAIKPSSDACNNWATAFSDTITIYVDPNCGEKQFNKLGDKKKGAGTDGAVTASLFPNPTWGTFSIEINGLQTINSADIKIYTVDGQVVYSTTVGGITDKNPIEISTNNVLAAGVYIISVSNTEFNFKQTLVIVSR